jgi:GntR family transcriptional regulator, transcriptional repressor for pyruvate dehydrogenase complex
LAEPGLHFEPISRRTVAEEIREAIANRIKTRQLPPGSQLPSERELCEQFGVARTSLREAIQGLIMLGLIERRGNRAYVVEHLPAVQLDGQDRRKRRVRELFEVRQVVEVPIARLAACHATDEQRSDIVEVAGSFSADMKLEEFRRLDREFHSVVARACGNQTLAELYEKVLESLFASREFDELLSAGSNRRAVREIIRTATVSHQAIAHAIASGDSLVVVDAAERHLDQVEDQMISKMV